MKFFSHILSLLLLCVLSSCTGGGRSDNSGEDISKRPQDPNTTRSRYQDKVISKLVSENSPTTEHFAEIAEFMPRYVSVLDRDVKDAGKLQEIKQVADDAKTCALKLSSTLNKTEQDECYGKLNELKSLTEAAISLLDVAKQNKVEEDLENELKAAKLAVVKPGETFADKILVGLQNADVDKGDYEAIHVFLEKKYGPAISALGLITDFQKLGGAFAEVVNAAKSVSDSFFQNKKTEIPGKIVSFEQKLALVKTAVESGLNKKISKPQIASINAAASLAVYEGIRDAIRDLRAKINNQPKYGSEISAYIKAGDELKQAVTKAQEQGATNSVNMANSMVTQNYEKAARNAKNEAEAAKNVAEANKNNAKDIEKVRQAAKEARTLADSVLVLRTLENKDISKDANFALQYAVDAEKALSDAENNLSLVKKGAEKKADEEIAKLKKTTMPEIVEGFTGTNKPTDTNLKKAATDIDTQKNLLNDAREALKKADPTSASFKQHQKDISEFEKSIEDAEAELANARKKLEKEKLEKLAVDAMSEFKGESKPQKMTELLKLHLGDSEAEKVIKDYNNLIGQKKSHIEAIKFMTGAATYVFTKERLTLEKNFSDANETKEKAENELATISTKVKNVQYKNVSSHSDKKCCTLKWDGKEWNLFKDLFRPATFQDTFKNVKIFLSHNEAESGTDDPLAELRKYAESLKVYEEAVKALKLTKKMAEANLEEHRYYEQKENKNREKDLNDENKKLDKVIERLKDIEKKINDAAVALIK